MSVIKIKSRLVNARIPFEFQVSSCERQWSPIRLLDSADSNRIRKQTLVARLSSKTDQTATER